MITTLQKLAGYTTAILITLAMFGIGMWLTHDEPIVGKSELKAPVDKIVKHETVSVRKCIEFEESEIIGMPHCKTIEEKYVVKYDYISDIITDKKPHYEKGINGFSSIEELEIRDDGKTPMAYYSEPKWYKDDNGTIFEIVKDATTTIEEFEEQTKVTLLEKFKSYFTRSSLAADTYTTNDTYTPPSAGTVEILLIGGGGGGGQNCSNGKPGGGGAGGYQYETEFAVTSQEYAIVVGGGGAGGASGLGAPGSTGSNSTFSTITANGGGFGGGCGSNNCNDPGGAGGCGGGGQYTSGGAGNQGGNGGTGVQGGAQDIGGGGGGASANGATGTGGDGTSNSITGSAVTYAGGGGGAGEDFYYAGGAGGGGRGNNKLATAPVAGTNGLGGGGGGAWCNTGGAGGSGVVIIVFTAGSTDTCTIDTTGRHAMDMQDHCTTTESVYSAYGMECYNTVGGSWVIGAGTEVRVASSTNCIPQIEATGVFSIQPSQ